MKVRDLLLALENVDPELQVRFYNRESEFTWDISEAGLMYQDGSDHTEPKFPTALFEWVDENYEEHEVNDTLKWWTPAFYMLEK